jgi:hypothetical protein
LKFAYVWVSSTSLAKCRTLVWPNLDRNKELYTGCLKFFMCVSSTSLFASLAEPRQKEGTLCRVFEIRI